MANKASDLIPLQILAGVMPSTDATPFSTKHFTYADKIRFWCGIPQKIGGWRNFPFSDGDTIEGYARSLYSAVIDNRATSLIGTNEKLYSLLGQDLTNITPLQTSTTGIANSLATDYATLANNPVTTVNGSNTLTIADTNASLYQVNDVVTLSGSSTVNGVPNTEINAAHIIRSIGTNSYTVRVSTSATSAGSGGGASVIRATGRLRVTAASHGMADGDRVKINGAANTGGILAADINLEFIIRNVASGTFDIFTDGTATSSVSGAGGASTTYQKQISSGNVNVSFGQGYGTGKYGVGKYGVSKISTTGLTYPRIWFFDRFADTVIMTAGNQTGLYQWDGNTATAPVLVTNAPTAINYAFVSNNIVVTLGAGGTPNRIFSSDQGDPTNWTASSTNQVYDDDIEGAAQLISHVAANGVNLIFTQNQTYLLSYIGLPFIWNIQLLDNSIGIIGPMARCSVNNVAYFMGADNFYMWRGGNIEIIPANSQQQSTCLNYVFKNINTMQSYKSFAWYNKQFNEIWFHYPSVSSNECDRIARVSLTDYSWVPDTMDRICAEYPANIYGKPRLISQSGSLYVHEYGTDDDTSPLAYALTSNLLGGDKKYGLISGFIPDATTSGTNQVRVRTYKYPQNTDTLFDQTYDVTSNVGQLPIQQGGRFWDYQWSGDELGQAWIMGQYMQFIQPSADAP